MYRVSLGRWTGPAMQPGRHIEMRYREDTNDWNTIQSIIAMDEYLTSQIPTSDPHSVFVDIGAHVGAWTRLMQELYPEGEFVAVEALKENVELIRMNSLGLALKHSPSIYHRAGWHNSHDRITLSYGDKAEGHHRFIANNSSTENDHSMGIEVETISLNEICDPFDNIRVLKIDCEGGEYPILDGADIETLEKIDYIIGEHHYFSPTCQGRDDLLKYTKGQFEDVTHFTRLTPSSIPIGEFLFKNVNCTDNWPSKV